MEDDLSCLQCGNLLYQFPAKSAWNLRIYKKCTWYKSTRMVRVISDEEVDNDRFLCGLLQQGERSSSNMDCFNREREEGTWTGKEKWIMMSNSPFYMDYLNRTSFQWFCTNVTGENDGAVFDVGRISWFQRGLLNGNFSSIVVHKNYKRRGFVQSWWGKELLYSSVVFYIKTGSFLFCTDITREEGGSSLQSFKKRRRVLQQVQPQYLITSNPIISWACGRWFLF